MGRLLGEGRTAEVFEFGDRRVIKLLLPGFSERALREEAIKTAVASAAGAPAPAVYGIEEVGGRPGIVFDRADGTLMLDLIIGSPHRARHWGRTLAAVHVEVLTKQTDQLADVRETLALKISRADALTMHEKAKASGVLADLPEGRAVLHGDFHPLNVYLGPGATVIDWLDASRGVPEADLARSFWLTTPHVIPPDFPWRWAVKGLARLLGRTYRSTVLGLVGVSASDVEPWTLPVLAGRLSEGIEHEEALLVREVRRRL